VLFEINVLHRNVGRCILDSLRVTTNCPVCRAPLQNVHPAYSLRSVIDTMRSNQGEAVEANVRHSSHFRGQDWSALPVQLEQRRRIDSEIQQVFGSSSTSSSSSSSRPRLSRTSRSSGNPYRGLFIFVVAFIWVLLPDGILPRTVVLDDLVMASIPFAIVGLILWNGVANYRRSRWKWIWSHTFSQNPSSEFIGTYREDKVVANHWVLELDQTEIGQGSEDEHSYICTSLSYEISSARDKGLCPGPTAPTASVCVYSAMAPFVNYSGVPCKTVAPVVLAGPTPSLSDNPNASQVRKCGTVWLVLVHQQYRSEESWIRLRVMRRRCSKSLKSNGS